MRSEHNSVHQRNKTQNGIVVDGDDSDNEETREERRQKAIKGEEQISKVCKLPNWTEVVAHSINRTSKMHAEYRQLKQCKCSLGVGKEKESLLRS